MTFVFSPVNQAENWPTTYLPQASCKDKTIFDTRTEKQMQQDVIGSVNKYTYSLWWLSEVTTWLLQVGQLIQ